MAFVCKIILIMRRLHIFNPETEYALAAGFVGYTPPAKIVALRRINALIPALYAHSGDGILLLDDTDPSTLAYFDRTHNLDLIRIQDRVDWSSYIAEPWGWNHSIAAWLSRHCPGIKGIPDISFLDSLRALAHRRTTIPILKAMGYPEILLPREFHVVDEVMRHCDTHSPLFFKAPWSSSGRGIIRTDTMSWEKVKQWVGGIIRSQGSVIAEPAYNKVLDFATEWDIRNGNATFLGVSVFEASSFGKYQRNFNKPQSELIQIINRTVSGFGQSMIDLQRHAIQSIIGTAYSGPLGIDMLADSEGSINPCVELNLRHTMGSILL